MDKLTDRQQTGWFLQGAHFPSGALMIMFGFITKAIDVERN